MPNQTVQISRQYTEPSCSKNQNNTQNQTVQISNTTCRTKLYKYAKQYTEPNRTNKQNNTQNQTVQITKPTCRTKLLN